MNTSPRPALLLVGSIATSLLGPINAAAGSHDPRPGGTDDGRRMASIDSTSSTAPPSPGDPIAAQGVLIASVGLAVSHELDGTMLPSPDAACFARAMDAVEPGVRSAADELTSDPLAWEGFAPDVQLPLVAGYVGCSGIDDIRFVLAIGIVNSIDVAPCVADSWRDELTAEAIVASISVGQGFDDLAPEIVETMVAGVAACLPDREWWIEDIALDIDQAFGLSVAEARCVARAYVSTLGIEAAIRRRVLTIPTLAVSPKQFAALQLAATCATDISSPPVGIDADIGECIASFASREQPATPVSCDSPHNVEVVSVIDLETIVDDWPGLRTVAQIAEESCIRDAEAAVGDRQGMAVSWSYPTRWTWEQGGRHVLCVVGRVDGADWTGSSGIVTTVMPTSTTPTPPAGNASDARQVLTVS